jgi:polyisoprenoid-binding protein YceI
MRIRFKTAVLFSVGFFLFQSSLVRAEDFTIDPMHSSVSFRIKHIIGKVTGHFDKFSGTFSYDPAKPAASSATATIEAASINTGIDKRDNHLRTPDFFDVQKFPTLSFKSTGVTDVQGDTAKLHGDLTMHGVTKPVVLDLTIAGIVKDPMGKGNRAGATATGKIKRSDFGIGATTGATAGMIGSDVEITIEIEGASK